MKLRSLFLICGIVSGLVIAWICVGCSLGTMESPSDNKSKYFVENENEAPVSSSHIEYKDRDDKFGYIEDKNEKVVIDFDKNEKIDDVYYRTKYQKPMKSGDPVSQDIIVEALDLEEITIRPDSSSEYGEISLISPENKLSLWAFEPGLESAVLNAEKATAQITGKNLSARLSVSGQVLGDKQIRASLDLSFSGTIDMKNEDDSLVISSSEEITVLSAEVSNHMIGKGDTYEIENLKDQKTKVIRIAKTEMLKDYPKITIF